jgi:hypothetical protein
VSFQAKLSEQRWDDLRYYHQSFVNQVLHLFSALAFIAAYGLIFFDFPLAIYIGWGVMIPRQVGHFFFEPKTFDNVNGVTSAYKESVKVGFNLKRKAVLLSLWVLCPIAAMVDSSLFGLFPASTTFYQGLAYLWGGIALAGLLFRTIQLFIIQDFETGAVWFTKIITDPFYDVLAFYKSPIHLLRGEKYDNMQERIEAHKPLAGLSFE